jgi:hypothetical protein
MDDFVTVDIYLLIFNVRQSYNSPFRNAILSISQLSLTEECSTWMSYFLAKSLPKAGRHQEKNDNQLVNSELLCQGYLF